MTIQVSFIDLSELAPLHRNPSAASPLLRGITELLDFHAPDDGFCVTWTGQDRLYVATRLVKGA